VNGSVANWRPATSGAVVTPQLLAADAGAELLAAGGSAVDAAIAAAFALCVVDPSNCGIGGYGGFLVYAPADGEPALVDFNTWVQAGFESAQLRAPGAIGSMVRGGASVAPPAVVAGLIGAHERFGRCARTEVLAPAIRLARHGFPIGPYLAWALSEHLADIDSIDDAEFGATFYPGGRPRAAGELLVQRELAATLEAIVDRGADALRTGRIAEAICEAVVADGGVLALADLADEHVVIGAPTTMNFAGSTLHGPPLEGSGTGVMFPALAAIDPARLGTNRGAAYVSELANALRSAWRARRGASADATSLPHTTHLCAAAPDGGLVALTFTHGPWFGSDLMAPGTGIVLNGGANLFAPSSNGGRAVTNMAPLILDGADGVRHAVGATGGPRIPAMLVSTVVDIVCYDATLDEAIAAPRLAVQAEHGRIEVEAGLEVEGAVTIGPGDFGPSYGITRAEDRYLVGLDARFEGGIAPS
jgi:gamma-glutamyltranspeptidase / glutathione hydrolase